MAGPHWRRLLPVAGDKLSPVTATCRPVRRRFVAGVDETFLLLLLSLPVEHRPQTTCLHPALSCAAASIFLQLYLYPAVHISFSRSLLQVFLGRPLPLWPCGFHCSACLVMLSSFRLNVCPSLFHFRLTSTQLQSVTAVCLMSVTCVLWLSALRVSVGG